MVLLLWVRLGRLQWYSRGEWVSNIIVTGKQVTTNHSVTRCSYVSTVVTRFRAQAQGARKCEIGAAAVHAPTPTSDTTSCRRFTRTGRKTATRHSYHHHCRSAASPADYYLNYRRAGLRRRSRCIRFSTPTITLYSTVIAALTTQTNTTYRIPMT